MISEERFKEIWKESKIEETMDRISELKNMGFTFYGDDGDCIMDSHENRLLKEWEEDHYKDTPFYEIPLEEIKKVKDSIVAKAKKIEDW